MKNRMLKDTLRRRAEGKLGRLLVLTGARQTGKTTLIRKAFPEVPYVSVEDPAVRPSFSRMSAMEWIERYPIAIIDEVQKAPSIVETIKAAYDASDQVRYMLLGSSQILLLSKVKESLAGRAAILELWPLTLPEMATSSWSDPVGNSRLVTWLKTGAESDDSLVGVPSTSSSFAKHAGHFDHYLRVGAMPVVHDPELSFDECRDWLHDYRRTYLERDVADLAALRDLEPFVVAQGLIAARTGRTINFNDIARSARIAADTARRFVRYLELSYQVVILRPFFRNPGKRLVKMPKIHFLDPGVMRSCLDRWGEPTGEEFESAVTAEIIKQASNASVRASFFYLRTYDGREVDLLIELEHGFVAIEIKQSTRVSTADARHLRDLSSLLDRPLLYSLILSQDRDARHLDENILALPAVWALSPPDNTPGS